MLAVLLAATAAPVQAAPVGFRESARLQPIAAGLAERPVFVRCATSESAWAAMLAPWDLPAGVDALTFPDNAGSYLAPRTCRELEGWLRGKSAPTPQRLGVVVLSLVHETMHLRGVDPEAEAECAALRAMPAVLRRWFGIKRAVTLRAVMNAAWANHRTKPVAYRTLC